MASLTRWTWIWASSRRQWRRGEHGMLQSTGSQRVRHNLATEQQQEQNLQDIVHSEILEVTTWTYELRRDTIQPVNLCPLVPPNSCTLCMQIHPLSPTAPRSAHVSINSKSKISFKDDLNQIWIRLRYDSSGGEISLQLWNRTGVVCFQNTIVEQALNRYSCSQREKSGRSKGSWVPSESKTKQGKIHQILRLKNYPFWCHSLSSRPPGVILLWGSQGRSLTLLELRRRRAWLWVSLINNEQKQWQHIQRCSCMKGNICLFDTGHIPALEATNHKTQVSSSPKDECWTQNCVPGENMICRKIRSKAGAFQRC